MPDSGAVLVKPDYSGFDPFHAIFRSSFIEIEKAQPLTCCFQVFAELCQQSFSICENLAIRKGFHHSNLCIPYSRC